jgi:hypothetical protein
MLVLHEVCNPVSSRFFRSGVLVGILSAAMGDPYFDWVFPVRLRPTWTRPTDGYFGSFACTHTHSSSFLGSFVSLFLFRLFPVRLEASPSWSMVTGFFYFHFQGTEIPFGSELLPPPLVILIGFPPSPALLDQFLYLEHLATF